MKCDSYPVVLHPMSVPKTHDFAALGLRAKGFDLPPDAAATALRLPDSFVAAARGTAAAARLDAAFFLRAAGEAS